MKAKEFDQAFESGKDITEFLDLDSATRPKQAQRRVNVDFPIWMIERLDREARRIGVTRQSIIKVWLAERLERQSAAESSGPHEPSPG
ncbi:MAG: CopG family antitoxin [Xanthomonadales bacterium]|nr:CopG family antitoxin [Xanthomonadales bacterium]